VERWPHRRLDDGGKARAEQAASQAVQRALAGERDELARRIALEVETSRRDLDTALATVTAADASRAAADEHERAAKERHEAGLAPISELLDAQAELATAEQEQVAALAAAWVATARLARALGQ
jgi:outer membrane protein